jgi:anthranilate synthase component 1
LEVKALDNKKSLFKIVCGERFTPFSLAKKFGAKALLESASFLRGRERYSILLIKKAFSIYQKDEKIFIEKNGKRYLLKSKGKDILDVLLYFASQHLDFQASTEGDEQENWFKREHFPLPAGGIGYLDYEYSSRFDTIKIDRDKSDPLDLPDASFIFGHIFLIYDHYTDTLAIVGLNYKEHSIDLDEAVAETEAQINDLNFNFMSSDNTVHQAKTLTKKTEKYEYMGGVEKVREEIIKGNILQGVLSRRVYIETDITALKAYNHLRSFNPSPYLFYLDFDEFQLFGSSPEVHVKVRDRKILLRPIAGTRKRGKDEAEDRALAKDLLSDEKELAEHLMLVDLARNDLGRICKPGSVEITEKMVIEKYSHVIHVVSQVEGELMDNKRGIDGIRATFPAGTVSGAPKIKAIEIIDNLEKEKRGFYAGIIAYIEPDGSLDSCITIRSAFKKKDRLVLQAGAGIVYDSVPEREFEETQSKLRALGKAIGIEV